MPSGTRGESQGARGRAGPGLLLAVGLLAGTAGALGLRSLELPGLYYDEAIQALPALQFLRGEGGPSPLPGMLHVRLFGGWFPVLTQPYMGALKSQLLLPSLALLPAGVETLRATTLAWGLGGLLLAAALAHRLLGPGGALATAALLAFDPSFLFVARHDWGSFALGLALRCGGLVLLLAGWEARPGAAGRRRALLAAGGAALGLGLYNKVDAAIPLAAAGAALALVAPRVPRAALGRRRADALAALGGLAAGAALLLLRAGDILRAARAYAQSDPGGAGGALERLRVLGATLDGSYFERLLLVGGRFDALSSVEGAAAGPFALAVGAAALGLAGALALGACPPRLRRTAAFLLVALGLGVGALLAVPEANRIHHALNLYPFPHLLVAAAALALAGPLPWGARRSARARARWLGAAALVAAVVAGQLRADLHTLATIERTGGKGRWSASLVELARALGREAEPPHVVCMDWGFGAPLGFLAPEVERSEPFWALSRRLARRGSWRRAGRASDLYLVSPAELALSPLAPQLLEAARALPPERVRVRTHRDREGDPAFYSVRFGERHHLVYRRRLRVILPERGAAASAAARPEGSARHPAARGAGGPRGELW